MPEIPLNAGVVSTIVGQLDGVTPQQVEQVLSTWNAVLAGDPPGTVRRSTDGEVAHRVVQDGVHMWLITNTVGAVWGNTAPTLAWPLIHEAAVDDE